MTRHITARMLSCTCVPVHFRHDLLCRATQSGRWKYLRSCYLPGLGWLQMQLAGWLRGSPKVCSTLAPCWATSAASLLVSSPACSNACTQLLCNLLSKAPGLLLLIISHDSLHCHTFVLTRSQQCMPISTCSCPLQVQQAILFIQSPTEHAETP